MDTLTGRIRFRTNLFRAQVLQVEVTYIRDFLLGCHIESETVTEWRDATRYEAEAITKEASHG